MKRSLFNLACWTWCLPQSLLGLVVLGWLKICGNVGVKYQCHYQRVYYINSPWLSGFSLGKFQAITISERLPRTYDQVMQAIQHEWGHCLQSLVLGPLYLIVAGLPSLVNNLRSRYSASLRLRYYSLYPEKWADKWGGVTRV